ncbi:Ig domain-containing protein [Escherichia coli]|nr:Ig domain-containing protein [Escherichia coli]HBN7443552.1 Ig domain-containing protein [Escherichia coli]HBQ4879991.1 Ig domain-containing protein [Escherichia coli]
MSEIKPTFTWESEDQKIATVDVSTGLVTGIKEGKVRITVTESETKKSASVELSVLPPDPIAVKSVTITPQTTSVETKKTVQLNVTFTPENPTNKNVIWASKNQNFATVDQSTGLVTGVAQGTATIEVTSADGGHKATATVNVTAAPSPAVA